MVSLKWGEVLSTLLPGAVALFAVAPLFPLLEHQLSRLDQIGLGGGVALLMAAALAGGVLEAITRVTWERHVLVKLCPSPQGTLAKLNSSLRLDLYERGVQSSYKYATFHANLGTAFLLLVVSRVYQGRTIYDLPNLVLLVTTGILFWASYVQWGYFVNYITKVFGGSEHVEERPASGDKGAVPAVGENREGE